MQHEKVLVLRDLLGRIRDVVAVNGNEHVRLTRIVSIIAKNMATEVCSIYVLRAGGILELFATQGLRATAVRRTRLRVGEGLIGEIAAKGRPLALSDAQSHPSFVLKPETGEEIYHSLMGVPIVLDGRVVGVLAVQTANRREYTDEEMALQTVAMVLAEEFLATPFFLRGLGLRRHHSCFLSYSSKDDAFATRLHADLQNTGVRCWFAPHDLQIGAKTWDQIDAAIRLRDKLLLILSKNAIASDWVEDEVGKAFAEERRRNQVVLFPIHIDDAVMKTSESWAVKLRDQRNIGDFRRWKEHDAYKQAFDRVLRDLKAAPENPFPGFP